MAATKEETPEILFTEEDPFRVERWYPRLRAETFETVFVALTVAEANAVAALAEHRAYLRQAVAFCATREEARRAKAAAAQSPLLTDEEFRLVSGLRERLDAAIAGFGADGAFVKLSTRSAKDSALDSLALRCAVAEDLLGLLRRHGGGVVEDAVWEAESVNSFVRACSRTLRVTSGAQAIEQLAASKRVQQDLVRLRLQGNDGQYKVQFAVRRWDAAIDPCWEFRAFAYHRRLTACTAYYKLCFVPEIAARKAEIAKLLLAYHDRIVREGLIEPESYTIDFAVAPDLSRVCVVEINNLPPTAGTALFDWDSPADRELILNGRDFLLRVNEQLVGHPLEQIHAPVRELINQLRDLRGAEPTIHIGYGCDCCSGPIAGKRYHCATCACSVDVCEACWGRAALADHPRSHTFVCFATPLSCIPDEIGPPLLQPTTPLSASLCVLQ